MPGHRPGGAAVPYGDARAKSGANPALSRNREALSRDEPGRLPPCPEWMLSEEGCRPHRMLLLPTTGEGRA
jgi:hypothetical protein